MEKNEWEEHLKKVKELHAEYPDVPVEIFDIEASHEMAAIYYDEFGY